ncbi:MAG: sulfotransferase [Deinococcales bacterium]
MTPLFLFSLPRSGSTLLQRILAAHPDIATLSEPWFILPLIYMTRDEGIYSEYDHSHLTRALTDLKEPYRKRLMKKP